MASLRLNVEECYKCVHESLIEVLWAIRNVPLVINTWLLKQSHCKLVKRLVLHFYFFNPCSSNREILLFCSIRYTTFQDAYTISYRFFPKNDWRKLLLVFKNSTKLGIGQFSSISIFFSCFLFWLFQLGNTGQNRKRRSPPPSHFFIKNLFLSQK